MPQWMWVSNSSAFWRHVSTFLQCSHWKPRLHNTSFHYHIWYHKDIRKWALKPIPKRFTACWDQRISPEPLGVPVCTWTNKQTNGKCMIEIQDNVCKWKKKEKKNIPKTKVNSESWSILVHDASGWVNDGISWWLHFMTPVLVIVK